MKKKLFFISIISIFSFMVIAGLHFVADSAGRHANHFNRSVRTPFIELLQEQELPSTGYKIVGGSANNVYLSNEGNPLTLLVSDPTSDKIHTRSIENKTGEKQLLGLLRVDSPQLSLLDPFSHRLFGGDLNSLQQLLLQNNTYDFILPVNDKTFAIRTFDNKKMEFNLAWVSKDSGGKVVPNLLKKQVDGLFSVDGTLDYNKKLARIIYCISTGINSWSWTRTLI